MSYSKTRSVGHGRNRVLPLELVNPYFYHLDTCFCPLAPGEALWYPDAFDAYGQKVIESQIARLLLVAKRPDEALQAIAREPESGDVCLLRAAALVQKGQLARALILIRLWVNTPCPHQMEAPWRPSSRVRSQPYPRLR